MQPWVNKIMLARSNRSPGPYRPRSWTWAPLLFCSIVPGTVITFSKTQSRFFSTSILYQVLIVPFWASERVSSCIPLDYAISAYRLTVCNNQNISSILVYLHAKFWLYGIKKILVLDIGVVRSRGDGLLSHYHPHTENRECEAPRKQED
jgi:hypothetical protein